MNNSNGMKKNKKRKKAYIGSTEVYIYSIYSVGNKNKIKIKIKCIIYYNL